MYEDTVEKKCSKPYRFLLEVILFTTIRRISARAIAFLDPGNIKRTGFSSEMLKENPKRY